MTTRFVPDTLFGQLISALLAVVAITMLIFVALVVRERRAFLFSGGEAGAIANEVAETSIALAALPLDARAAEIARLAAEPITISRSGDLRQPLDPNDYAAELSSLRSRLERALPLGYAVALRPARPAPRSADAIRIRTQAPGPHGPGACGSGVDDEAPAASRRRAAIRPHVHSRATKPLTASLSRSRSAAGRDRRWSMPSASW